MSRERQVTDSAIVFFKQDAIVSELNKMMQDFSGDIIISRDLILDEDLNLKSNLYVMGSVLRMRPKRGRGDIKIHGDLYCYEDIDCFDIYVQGFCYCEGDLYPIDVMIGEDLFCKGSIDDGNCNDLNVAGELICSGRIEASIINVCGKIRVTDEIICKEINVGY